jgi:hypothetical protein
MLGEFSVKPVLEFTNWTASAGGEYGGTSFTFSVFGGVVSLGVLAAVGVGCRAGSVLSFRTSRLFSNIGRTTNQYAAPSPPRPSTTARPEFPAPTAALISFSSEPEHEPAPEP